MLSPEEELVLVRHVHLLSERIRTDKELTSDRLHFIKDVFPDLYSILAKLQPDETIKIFEKYRDHPFFKTDMEIALSPKGKEWVAKEVELFRAHSKSAAEQHPTN